MPYLRPLSACLLVICALVAVEDDPLAKELSRYDDAIAKAQKNFDDTVAKERGKTIPVLITLAKKVVGKGDMPGAVKAWKAVLRLDGQQVEARQFFTSIGQLDKVLAELEAEESAGGDLLGDGAGPVLGKPWEGTVTVRADKPMQLGDLPTGTKITLQYLSGAWTFRSGVQPMTSPDDEAAPPLFHLALSGEPGVIQELPAGSAKTPWNWSAPVDVKGAVLRMSRAGRAPAGSVTYRITVAKPKAK